MGLYTQFALTLTYWLESLRRAILGSVATVLAIASSFLRTCCIVPPCPAREVTGEESPLAAARRPIQQPPLTPERLSPRTP